MIRLSELLESFETLTPRLKLAIREAERLEAVEEAYDENTQAFLKDDANPDNGPWGQVPEGTRWAIVRDGPGVERWRAAFAMTHQWRITPLRQDVITFDTYQDAAECIKERNLDAQPWPVPAS